MYYPLFALGFFTHVGSRNFSWLLNFVLDNSRANNWSQNCISYLKFMKKNIYNQIEIERNRTSSFSSTSCESCMYIFRSNAALWNSLGRYSPFLDTFFQYFKIKSKATKAILLKLLAWMSRLLRLHVLSALRLAPKSLCSYFPFRWACRFVLLVIKKITWETLFNRL